MNEPQPDQLDDMLRQWADQRTVDDEHVRRLGKRIGQALSDDTLRVLDDLTAQRTRVFQQRIVLTALSAAAALLLVAAGVFWLNRPGHEPIAPEFAWLTDQQVRNKQTLWTEFDQTFDQRLTWIAETSNQVELGLADDDAAAPNDSRPVAVRIVVARRTAGKAWQPVWAADVISRTGQLVRLPRQGSESVDLAMRTHLLSDGQVEVDTTLEIDNQKLHSSESSKVLRDRTPTVVVSQETDGVEYQVFQTVALLKEDVG